MAARNIVAIELRLAPFQPGERRGGRLTHRLGEPAVGGAGIARCSSDDRPRAETEIAVVGRRGDQGLGPGDIAGCDQGLGEPGDVGRKDCCIVDANGRLLRGRALLSREDIQLTRGRQGDRRIACADPYAPLGRECVGGRNRARRGSPRQITASTRTVVEGRSRGRCINEVFQMVW